MILSINKLLAAGVKEPVAMSWIQPLDAAVQRFHIGVTEERLAWFIAETAWESQFFTHVTENLNYSAQGLMATFKGKFDLGTATEYQHQPEKIANYVYANRFGNGDEASGDGWKYRGRCPMQITFHDNYLAIKMQLGIECVEHPELLEVPDYGALAAGTYWSSRGLNELADVGNYERITVKIHGDVSTHDKREEIANRILKAA